MPEIPRLNLIKSQDVFIVRHADKNHGTCPLKIIICVYLWMTMDVDSPNMVF